MTHLQSAASPTTSGSRFTAPTPDWLSVGAENADPDECHEGGCVGDYSAPTDLFCQKHDRFLPLSSRLPSRRKTIAINLSRLIVLGAFDYSARFSTSVPLDVLGAVLGGLLLLLPLRALPPHAGGRDPGLALRRARLRTGRDPHQMLHRTLGTTVLVIVLGGSTVYLGRWLAALIGAGDPRAVGGTPHHRADRQHAGLRAALRTPGQVAGLVVAPAVAAPSAILLLLALSLGPAQWVFRPPSVIQTILVTTAIGGPVTALCLATVAGLLEGAPTVDRRVPPEIRRADHAASVHDEHRSGREPGPSDVADHRGDGQCGSPRGARAGQKRRANCELDAQARRHHRQKGRRHRALRCRYPAERRDHRGRRGDAHPADRAAADGGHRRGPMPLLIPSASALTRYLLSGGFADLGLGVAGAATLAAAVTAVWMLLSNLPTDLVLRSATRNVEELVARVLVLIATGGLALGALGSLGYGRIHIGVVTLSVDLIVTLTFVKAYARGRLPLRGSATK